MLLCAFLGLTTQPHYVLPERSEIGFHAEMNQRNASLLPERPNTTYAKVVRFASHFFSLGIPYALKKMTVKYYCKDLSSELQNAYAQFWAGEESSSLRKIFTPEHRTVVTPDGAKLHAIIYRHKNGDEQTPTLLYCNGLGQLQETMEINEYLTEHSVLAPCHFVTFNYRSVTSQEKLTSSNDFIVDTEAVLQLIERELQTCRDRIHFHGRSLGGGVAVKTQALDSTLTGVNINESSFASLGKVIERLMGRSVAALNDMFDFGMEVESDFERLNAKRKIVMIHPEDNVVQFGVSLANAIRERLDERTKIIYLRIKPGFVPRDTIHSLSINAFEDSSTKASPLESVAQAIYLP